MVLLPLWYWGKSCGNLLDACSTVGVGVWSDDDAQGQPANRNQQNQDFLDQTLAPIVNDFTAKSCNCRATKCSGHGRCYIPHGLYPRPMPPPAPPPHPGPPPAPGPPGPAPAPPKPKETCESLMQSLAGPTVTKNKFCQIPKCTDGAAGCPTNTTRCLECVQFHGAHAHALKSVGCTDALVTKYCDSLGKPPHQAVRLHETGQHQQQPQQNEKAGAAILGGGQYPHMYHTAAEAASATSGYVGPLFGDDSLCFCDQGYTGEDCSVPAEVETPPLDAAAAPSDDQEDDTIICPDGRSTCPSGSSCASLSTGAWGCCATPNAVICDCSYCCPMGYTCNATGGVGSATHCEK